LEHFGQFYFILCFEMCKQLVSKPHGEREVRVYNGDLGAEPPAESRGTAELMVRGSGEAEISENVTILKFHFKYR